MYYRGRKKAEGFTLIELLIVVAIIGILAAIAIPNFVSASTKTKYGRALADTKVMVAQATLYNNDNNQPPTLAQLEGGNYMSWARDPFATTNCDAAVQTGCYQYAFTAVTPARAHSIGSGSDATAWDGDATPIGVTQVGMSSKVGCAVGATAAATYSVKC